MAQLYVFSMLRNTLTYVNMLDVLLSLQFLDMHFCYEKFVLNSRIMSCS